MSAFNPCLLRMAGRAKALKVVQIVSEFRCVFNALDMVNLKTAPRPAANALPCVPSESKQSECFPAFRSDDVR